MVRNIILLSDRTGMRGRDIAAEATTIFRKPIATWLGPCLNLVPRKGNEINTAEGNRALYLCYFAILGRR